ncbi:guanylate-binding protein 1-like, partial [Salvelinus alpinus]|uniref:guanylate-binding protein 1-like n=1 Tax=Salvelinus alpinus TaxID=8036 RepID=UPI0039FC2B64
KPAALSKHFTSCCLFTDSILRTVFILCPQGFALGATIQSKTKGIWMWCVPHPEKRDHTLVLLDTEGLGDVEKGDEKNDNWIFSLAVLLSSTLVYNSLGTIDNNALEKLHYVTELTEHIKVKSNQRDGEESSEYLRYFPSFVWTVRDFTLTLEVDGRPITANEYLENALKLRTGHSKKDQAYNLPRSCLRNYFSPRWCFVFERPASGDKMRRMEELTDADLEPAFVEQAKEFCDHVFKEAKTKTLKQGLKVTGRLLGNLAETYVSAIRSGQIPCLDNAVLALAQIENAEEVLKEYLERKAIIGQTILSADQSLTEAEQRAEAEQAKREASERENQAMEEQLVVQERLRADQQRTYEENVNQLMERMERDSRNAVAEHDRVLQARLKEQNDLLQQGFDDRAHQMQREIDALKGAKAQEEEKKPSFMSTALDTVGTAATLFLPGILPKVGGMAVKWLSKWF